MSNLTLLKVLLEGLKFETDRAYGVILDRARKAGVVDHDFAPYDLRYLVSHIEQRRNELDFSLPITDLESVLRRTLQATGLDQGALSLLYHPPNSEGWAELRPSELSMRSDPSSNERTIHFFVTAKDQENQTGVTEVVSVTPRHVVVHANVYEDTAQAYRIAFHELGHALHFAQADCELGPELDYLWPPLSEAFAQLFESLLLDEQWLSTQAKLEEERIRELRARAASVELVQIRSNIAWAMFEIEIHETANSDISAVLARYNERLLFYKKDAEISGKEWAARGHQLLRQPFTAQEHLWALVLRELLRQHTMAGPGVFDSRVADALTRAHRASTRGQPLDFCMDTLGDFPHPKYVGEYYDALICGG